MKLYELAEKYNAIHEYIENALYSDDLTEDDLQMFIDMIDSIEDALEVKIENTVKFLKNIEGEIKIYKEEEKRLAQKRKYLENKYNGLKEYMQNVLEANGIQKVKAGLFNVRIQKSPPSLEVLDESKIPADFKVPQPDKIKSKEILEAIKSGMQIEGVRVVDDKKHIRFS